MSLILTKIKNKYVSLRGFHTKRKLVVIESDDWGSIRMPSKETLDRLVLLGDMPRLDAFLSNDCLESKEDLLALYEVLCSVKDTKGNPAVMTANFAMANPKFEEIESDKGIYQYEPFYQTYDRYYGSQEILDVVKQGHETGYFIPQLHCREHMNVARWMKALNEHRADAILAYQNHMIGVGASFSPANPFGYMDAFNTDCSTNEELAQILADANTIFKNAFGFQSQSFVASCYVWNRELERELHRLGIRYIQSAPWQNYPIGTNGSYRCKRKLRYAGQTNGYGQIYGVRNCDFEPAIHNHEDDIVGSCFSNVANAFNNKKPAVICSHRLNYIGTINAQNRERGLASLQKLLYKIVEQYPDVEFISSPELFAIMEKEK